ncbi:MFS general substrate transporter [Rhizopogon vinicolor AM-OR11-026]|uniref:MFS general substrate transporter n=1 Tax=Rhizopogon vinicolor AM-OR11-026 TaxID=1314800 RepID=A0A1B7MH75_9AGAM|nr:MFS general substrate transporter [Rhizopogon vinicolor AM-OR11-026]
MSKATPAGGEHDSPINDFNLEKAKQHDVKQHDVAQRSLLRSVFIVVTCTAAMVVNISNTTSVSISLPTIGKDIDIQEDQLQWLASAYSLSSGCLLLFFGRLADLYGRKKAFMIGSLCQIAFSLGCGFANGVGGAATIPSALGMLAHAFPPSRARSIAFATFAAGAPVGGAFGMIIGGVLTQLTTTTWRSVFYLAAGASTLILFTGMVSFDADTPSTETVKRVDWIGASLITIGLVFIVFVLGQGELATNGWKTPYIIALLILGVIMVVLFVFWERHLEKAMDDSSRARSWWTPPPLMRPSIWGRSNGRMAVILAIAFLNWSGFISWGFWAQVCAVHIQLPARTDQYLSITGTLLTASGGILFAVIDPSVTYWAFGFPSTVLIVFGADFVYSCGTIFIAKTVLPHEHSVGGALFQTMTQIGAFGLTITTIVFNTVVDNESAALGVTVNSDGTNAPQSAHLKAYQSAQWGVAAFALMAALLAALFLRSVGIVGHKTVKVIRHADSDQTMAEHANRPRFQPFAIEEEEIPDSPISHV